MTEQTLMTYSAVFGSFILYTVIAVFTKARSTSEFYVADGSIGPIANGMATAADWMSAASFISMAGMIAFMGYGGSVFLMGWTGGYVLLALLIAPYLRKYGKFTVPEFIGERYYSRTARIVAVLCLILASITYIIGQMKGIGVAFSRFLEIDYSAGLLSGMAIVFIYAVLGGMKGITYTQIAQYIIMVFAYTLCAVFISLQVTGHILPQLGLGATLIDSNMYLLDKLDLVLTDLGWREYTTALKFSTLNMVAFTLTLMVGTAGLPHVIIRFFTVSTMENARKSAGWALVFIAVLYTTAPSIAAMGRYILVDTFHGTESGMVYEQRPQWFKSWEKTGLLQVDDKNADGVITYNADADTNELVKIDRDIFVLALPEIAKLPKWVIALVAAGGIAAALSTAAGLLLAIASAISHDLIKCTYYPKISARRELLIGRIAMIVALLLASYLGLNPPDFAAGTVALAFGLAASSLFPSLVMGIFSVSMNRDGAIAGMLAGISVTLLYVFQHKGVMFIPSLSYMGTMPQNWFFGIEPNAFGIVGAVVNFIVAYTVKCFSAPTPQNIQQLVLQLRTPS